MGRRDEDDRISVSSVVYNLAGPEEGRIDFLKSIVIGAVQREAPIADAIVSGLQQGPGIRYWKFINWAKNNSEFMSMFGTTSGTLATIPTPDKALVQAEIPVAAGEEVESVELAEIDSAKIHYWVLQYWYLNYPDPTDKIPKPAPYTGLYTYTYTVDSGTGEATVSIIVPNPDFDSGIPEDPITNPSTVLEVFTTSGFSEDPDDQFLYVKYVPAIAAQEDATVWDPEVILDPADPDPEFFPPWLLVRDTSAGVFETDLTAQDELDSVYSDGRPSTHHDYAEIVTPASAPTSYVHYIQDVYMGADVDGAKHAIRTHKEFWTEWEVDTKVETLEQEVTLSNGVTRTDTITRTTQYLKQVRKTRLGTQKIIWKTLLPPRWYIYQKGTGNLTLDEMMTIETAPVEGDFYPPIPFRYNNKAVGPLRMTARRWLIHTGDLGFSWVDDRYLWFIDSDKRDVQVAKSLDGPWVSTKWVGAGPSANTYYVESRLPGEDADAIDEEIEEDHPLYRVFQDATESNPGYYRVRGGWDANGDNTWTTILVAPTKLLSKPVPNSHGIDASMEAKYEVAKKAFKKAYGGKFEDVLKSVQENGEIRNIDYVYAVFGVSLNVKENACKKYIYKFLQHLMQQGGVTQADDFAEQYHAAHASQVAWKEWWKNTHNEDGSPKAYEETSTDGKHVDELPPEPTRIPFPQVRWHTLEVNSVHAGLSDYKTKLIWGFIDENQYTGVLTKPDGAPAEPGDLFFKVEANPFPVIDTPFETGPTSIRTPLDYLHLNNRVSLNWQVDGDTWKQLVITGMRHVNNIYKDHSVIHTAAGAVNWTQRVPDVDENGEHYMRDTGIYAESPFIFPMHETVFREMSLADATQMANACTFLVFNTYEEKEEKWYESTWFKVIVIAVIVIIAVVAAVWTGGASLGAAGSAIAGGLWAGAASTTFVIIVGALADVLIGFALSYFVAFLATAIFGEKVGSIVGAVLGLVLGGFVGGGFDLDAVTNLFTTGAGWISLGIALTNGTAGYLNASAQEQIEETIRMMAEKNVELAKLQEMYNEEFGKRTIDPLAVNKYINEILERPENFLRRTLMTGFDIVEATLREIDEFVETRLDLALP